MFSGLSIVPPFTTNRVSLSFFIELAFFLKSVVGTVSAKAGEEFMVYCLLRNNGADDLTYVQVKDGDEVVAEKLYTVCGGSWRVVEIPVTIATPGEHTITVGTQSGTITIAE